MVLEVLDISYYYQGTAAVNTSVLDVPLSNGQIVSLNLDEELPDDSLELVNFLELENCPTKYWISVAQGYCFKGKNDEALKLIDAGLNLQIFNEEDRVKFHGFLSWLSLKNASELSGGAERAKLLSKALQEIDYISRSDPSNVSNLLAKAVYNLYNGSVEKSLEIFDKLLKIDSSNCFALLGKAQIMLKKTKNYAAALKLYQQVLLINPTMKPDPRLGIGLCFWLLKDEKMAITSWERSFELDANSKAKILLNLTKFNQLFNESLTDEEFIESYESALKELSNLHKDSPKDNVILMALVPYYFTKGQYDIVTKICDKVTSSTAQSTTHSSKLTKFQSSLLSSVSLWLGRVSFAQSDFTKAQKYFHESIKLNDQNLLAKLGLGQSQISRGLIEEAIITYESILKTDPKCVEVIYSLGILYSKQKGRRKQEASIAMFERYLRLCNKDLVSGDNTDSSAITGEPVILNALLTLSKLYETKDINQSLSYLNKAIQSRKTIGKDVPLEVYNNVGVIHFLKNNYESSSQFFETSQLKLSELEDKDEELELSLTVSYNVARSKEISNELKQLKSMKN